MILADAFEIGILVYVAIGAIYVYVTTDKKDNEGS
tara:strand:+ start:285 stop:389 length:105 start_codon:yes stop_codon:yes gene_type:complete